MVTRRVALAVFVGLHLFVGAACQKSPAAPSDPASQLPRNPNPPVPEPPAKLYFRALDDDRQLNIWIQDLVFKPPVNSTVIGFQTNGYSALNCAMNMCPEFAGNVCVQVPVGADYASAAGGGQFYFSDAPKKFEWYMGGDGQPVANGEGQTACAPFNYTNGVQWLSPFPFGQPTYWEVKTTQFVTGPNKRPVIAEVPAYLSIPTGYYNPCPYQSPCIPSK